MTFEQWLVKMGFSPEDVTEENEDGLYEQYIEWCTWNER